MSLEEWLTILHCQNDKPISWHDTVLSDLRSLRYLGEGNLSPPPVFLIIYQWCKQLKQPVSVSYRTVELYERFIRSYYCQRFRLATEANKSETVTAVPSTTPKKIIFQEIYTEIRHQSLLHLVSCFQIASKLEDGYKVENAHYLHFKQLINQRFLFLCSWLQYQMQLTFSSSLKDPVIVPPL